MRILICLVAVSTGCVPVVVPPVHMRLGSVNTSSVLKRESSDGTLGTTTQIGELTFGLDSTTFAELPFSIESGVVTDVSHSGVFLEGGYLRRLAPILRFGATGGSEYWWGDNHGFGVRTALTLEYVRPFRQRTTTEHRGNDRHHRATEYIAQSGTPGIGVYMGAGYRSLADEKYGYFVLGISIHLPAVAAILDALPPP